MAGANNRRTAVSIKNREMLNAKYLINNYSDLKVKRTILERLEFNKPKTIKDIMQKADVLARTSVGKWKRILNELQEAKMVTWKDDALPFFIEINKITKQTTIDV